MKWVLALLVVNQHFWHTTIHTQVNFYDSEVECQQALTKIQTEANRAAMNIDVQCQSVNAIQKTQQELFLENQP